jgi:NAD(P)-dependent dehydrogenase (short-subunit alcohol dehydrogenase family)
MTDLAGQRVLVTGGSRGIGRAVARGFAAAGAVVAVHYRADRDAARATLAGLPGEGHLTVAGDIADPDAVARMVDEAAGALGGIDILVNNAGVYLAHGLADLSYREWRAAWDRTLAVNLTGPANVTFCVAQRMIRAGNGGRIVNISSRGAFRGEPGFPAYGASKAGLNSFGQSLAQELAPHRIYVTTVAPGFVATDMARPHLDGPGGDAIRAQSPLGRAAEPEEIARLVVFLAAPGTEYATGAIVDANGASYLRT